MKIAQPSRLALLVLLGAIAFGIYKWNTMGGRRAERAVLTGEVADLAREAIALRRAREGGPRAPEAFLPASVLLPRLRELFEARPAQRIPEMALLDEADWLRAAARARFGSEDDMRRSLAEVREIAREKFRSRLLPALQKLAAASGDRPPGDIQALAPYFDPPVDPALLARYELVPAGRSTGLMGSTFGYVVRDRIAVDPEYDSRAELGLEGALVRRAPLGWKTDTATEGGTGAR